MLLSLILKQLAHNFLPVTASGERSTAGTKHTCVMSFCAIHEVWVWASGLVRLSQLYFQQ